MPSSSMRPLARVIVTLWVPEPKPSRAYTTRRFAELVPSLTVAHAAPSTQIRAEPRPLRMGMTTATRLPEKGSVARADVAPV